MTLSDIAYLIIVLSFLRGIWNFISIYIQKRSYDVLNNGESFYMFLCNHYSWKIRSKLNLSAFYNGRAYIIFKILIGIIEILIGSILLVLIFYVKSTDYKELFNIKI